MEERSKVTEFKNNLSKVSAYKENELIKRSEWGEINFENYSFTFERLWNTIGHLQTLPVEYLSDSVLSKAAAKLLVLEKHLKNIDEFKIAGTNNPEQERNKIAEALKSQVDSFDSIIAIWIPFLAYQKGDISKNISTLQKAIDKTESELDKTKEKAQEKLGEIDEVSKQAKEAAATAGAAVFTQEFETEAGEQIKEANKWLWSTIILAVLTSLIAITVLALSFLGYEVKNEWLFISSKLTLFIFFFTATIWSGKIYRSLKHQAAINKHRALGLKTFQAFSHAALDDAAKNAVLLETTRSIFANTNTGLVDANSSKGDSEIKIVELLKSVTKTGE